MADASPSDPLQSALLSSLIGGQGGGSGGLDLQSLLAAQTGSGQTGAPDLAGLLGAQGGASSGPGDDRLQIALRWLEQRRAAAEQSAPPAEAPSEPSEAEIELQRLEAARQERERQDAQRELKEVTDALYTELEMLRARNDTLAAAVGACHLCFGEDLTCPRCRGRGKPGSRLPDGTAFRQYVVPALRRVRVMRARTVNVAPPSAIAEGQPPGNHAAGRA